MEVKGTIVEEILTSFDTTKAVYIKLHAPGIKSIPQWLDGSGNKGWLFIDEVVIR